MEINTITNNTHKKLELWDAHSQIADLAPGQSIHHLPPTIISVTCGGVKYSNRQGMFKDKDSYSATFQDAPVKEVIFTGEVIVRFS